MIIEIFMSILFNRCAPPQVDPIISTSARSSISSSKRCSFHPFQIVFVFPTLPPFVFLQGFRFLNQVSILFMWSLFILFNQCSYPVILMKMLYKFIILHYFSSLMDSIQALSIISFPRFKCFLMPVHLLIIHFSLFNCSEVPNISQKIRVSTLHSFNLFRGC